MVILLESASMGDGHNSHLSAKVFINYFKIELLKKVYSAYYLFLSVISKELISPDGVLF